MPQMTLKFSNSLSWSLKTLQTLPTSFTCCTLQRFSEVSSIRHQEIVALRLWDSLLSSTSPEILIVHQEILKLCRTLSLNRRTRQEVFWPQVPIECN